MADYLIRRNGRYSYRRRYPNEVAAILGKSEFVKALGTADPKEAARLARKVSVRFDDECDAALASLARNASMPSARPAEGCATPSDSDVAKSVIDRLPGIIRTVTESVIAEQERNRGGWMNSLSWRKESLRAHIACQMPVEIAMHPLIARKALDAIEAAERGEPLVMTADDRPSMKSVPSTEPAVADAHVLALNQEQLEVALAEYGIGKSHRRKTMARRQAQAMLSLPCSQNEAIAMVTAWCKAALSKGKKPSSVWTEASAVNALLKYVPGWHQFSVPKVGELRQLRGAGKARRGARASMPVGVLHQLLRAMPSYVPRGGEYWHAVLLLCALYGLRPGELLGAGQDALQEVETIWSTPQLVFRVGLTGAKNESSRRDLPVPTELRPLFELALSRQQRNSETTRTRVDTLNSLVGKAQGEAEVRHTMYSVRHLFADIARDCGYSEAQFGPLMGHKSASGITAIYGGTSTLESERTILQAVQHKLFPNGLTQFWPAGLMASDCMA